jgi:hypothetical protein
MSAGGNCDEGPWIEEPIAWRVHWMAVPNWSIEQRYRPAPQHQDFTTKAEAEAERLRLSARFGSKAVVHIQPRYLSTSKRERKLAAQQNSLTVAGWPIKMRPPRPGMTSKGRRLK